MAERRKVRPDCIYASNPFHECTDYCIKKTAESKAGKDKKSKGNNSVPEFQSLLALINYFFFIGFNSCFIHKIVSSLITGDV